MMKERKAKKPVKMKPMPACTRFLSLGRQLKTESHPCGSGSDLPRTKAFAFASFAPIPSLTYDSFGWLAAV